jgi:adenylosuccinate synthase
MRYIVYGAQFGSEGKGCVSEYMARQFRERHEDGKLVVIGENSPNSGHTCTLGKTRNIPAGSFFADTVVLGPDSAISAPVLRKDMEAVRAVNPGVVFKVHEHACLMDAELDSEMEANLVESIGSTGSGSGFARLSKSYYRTAGRIVRDNLKIDGVEIIDRREWIRAIGMPDDSEGMLHIFEASQGLMLDTNLGYYPFVTSRSTHPAAALARNGFDPSYWMFAAVYRTFPIRTGGNSGHTGGEEVSWEAIGVPSETATVTGRTRRVFRFSITDFTDSLTYANPDVIFVTHMDYLSGEGGSRFLNDMRTMIDQMGCEDVPIMYSYEPAKFNPHN